MQFVLIDDIIDMVPGRTIHGVKTLPAGEALFGDHFPGFPVVPGVLLIEMMAQTAGKCLDAEDSTRGKAMLVQVHNGSFRQWVRPDERADIYAEITASTPVYGRAACRITVDGRDVAGAELLFAFLPYSQLAAGFRDDVLERYLEDQAGASTERRE